MFAVISCTAIPDHVRGFLTRFFSEVSTGLYVGIVSPVVLDNLWARIVSQWVRSRWCIVAMSGSRVSIFG